MHQICKCKDDKERIHSPGQWRQAPSLNTPYIQLRGQFMGRPPWRENAQQMLWQQLTTLSSLLKGWAESDPNITGPRYKHAKESLFDSVFKSWVLFSWGMLGATWRGYPPQGEALKRYCFNLEGSLHIQKKPWLMVNRSAAKGLLWGGKEW